MIKPDYKGFAIEVMEGWPEAVGEMMDGMELQDMAERHGMLVPKEMNKPCADYCWCEVELGASEFPLTCYRHNWDKSTPHDGQEL